MMGGSCRGVVAAPVAVRGVGVPEKSSCLRRMTPRVTVGVIQHNGQLIHVSGGLDVTWDMHRSLGGRVLAAVVPWGPKVAPNDSGGPGGELVGLWGSALC